MERARRGRCREMVTRSQVAQSRFSKPYLRPRRAEENNIGASDGLRTHA